MRRFLVSTCHASTVTFICIRRQCVSDASCSVCTHSVSNRRFAENHCCFVGSIASSHRHMFAHHLRWFPAPLLNTQFSQGSPIREDLVAEPIHTLVIHRAQRLLGHPHNPHLSIFLLSMSMASRGKGGRTLLCIPSILNPKHTEFHGSSVTLRPASKTNQPHCPC